MTGTTTEIRIAGLKLRVESAGSAERTMAVVNAVESRLKHLENTSAKLNTQAFALQAAYEFARELDELRGRIAEEESSLRHEIDELAQRITEFRGTIDAAVESHR